MSETELKDESNDNAKSDSKRTSSLSSTSLRNKINAIRENAKNEIATLKNDQGPLKQDIRGKVYEINRRIKALNRSIEQNLIQIDELKNIKKPGDFVIPPKFAIKLKKLDNQNNKALISVFEDILVEHNKVIEDLDTLYAEKVSLINSKAEKQIETERKNNSKRRKTQAEKAKIKAKSALEAKREERKKNKEEERENGLAFLRQNLPLHKSAPIRNKAELPAELSFFYEVLDQSFDLVDDSAVVAKIIEAKSVNKYFSIIHQTMADAIGGISPADLLVISFEQPDEGIFDLILHIFKNRRIERLATQCGFVKLPNANLKLPLDLSEDRVDAVLSDVALFFADLGKKGFCKYIFDAKNNALFKVK